MHSDIITKIPLNEDTKATLETSFLSILNTDTITQFQNSIEVPLNGERLSMCFMSDNKSITFVYSGKEGRVLRSFVDWFIVQNINLISFEDNDETEKVLGNIFELLSTLVKANGNNVSQIIEKVRKFAQNKLKVGRYGK